MTKHAIQYKDAPGLSDAASNEAGKMGIDTKASNANRVKEIDAAVRRRIKFVRTQQGYTQSAVAEQLGIVPQQYHKYESGLLRLTGGMIVKIAAALGCSVLDLVPEDSRAQTHLDPTKRLDILKHELTMLILDQTSEETLIGLKMLLRSQLNDGAAAN